MDDYLANIDNAVERSSAFLNGGWWGVVLTSAVIIAITAIASFALVRVAHKVYHYNRDGGRAGSIIDVCIRVAVWACGIYVLFKNCFNFDLSVVIGALGIGGIALSLGLQDTIKNLLGGIQITFNHEIEIGNWIQVGSVEGVVVDVNLRNTTLRDDLNFTHIIPNSVINSTTVTRKPEFFRVDLDLVLERSVDLSVVGPHICDLANEALDAKSMRSPGKSSFVIETGVGADGVAVRLAVFSTWDFTTSQVKGTVMEPVVSYLQENNLIGSWAHTSTCSE